MLISITHNILFRKFLDRKLMISNCTLPSSFNYVVLAMEQNPADGNAQLSNITERNIILYLRKEKIIEVGMEKKITGIVYKYHKINSHLENLFKDKTIWHSPADSFNDPFEFKAIIIENTKAEEIRKWFQSTSRKFDEETLDKIVNAWMQKDSKERAEWLTNTCQDVLKKGGVSCFSLRHDNLLMWAHYGDYHKGVCLEFNVEHDLTFFKDVLAVNYKEEYPKIDLIEKQKHAFTEIITTKSAHWQYEEEYRSCKQSHGAIPFNPEALRSVIFGCRVDESIIDNNIQIIKNAGFGHVNFVKANLKKDSYGLDFGYLEVNNFDQEEIPGTVIIKNKSDGKEMPINFKMKKSKDNWELEQGE